MAKQSGIGMTLTVEDAAASAKDITNDVTELSWETPRETQEVTGLDKGAMERLLLLADFSVELTGVFNAAANKSHDVFKTVPSTSVARTTAITIPTPVSLTGDLLYNTYSIERSDSGELTWSAEGSLADGTTPTWA